MVDTKEREDSIKNQKEIITIEAKVLRCGVDKPWTQNSEALVRFAHPFWVRTTTETRVRKGNID